MADNEIEEPTEEEPVPEPEPEPEPEAEPEGGKSETNVDDQEEKEEQPISTANIETVSSPQATALVTYDSFENIGRAIADYLQGKWSGQKFTTKKPGGEDGEEVETEPVFVLLDAPHDLYNSEYTANYEVSTYDPTQDIISLVRNNTRIPIKVADDGESLLYDAYDALGIFVVTARAPDPPAVNEEVEEGVVQKTWIPDEKAVCSDKVHNCLSSLKVGGFALLIYTDGAGTGTDPTSLVSNMNSLNYDLDHRFNIYQDGTTQVIVIQKTGETEYTVGGGGCCCTVS